jgi:hypothetical protein
MGADYEASILYWVLIDLNSWGQALVRADRVLDSWARRCDNPLPHYGVPYRPTEWREIEIECGDTDIPLNSAERQSYSRALKALEVAGVVEVCRRGGRAGFIRPTPKGLAVALRLHESPDRRAVRKAVETAAWGTPEHLQAIDLPKGRKRHGAD